ncbi:MAG: sulfide/dihydroorotate dehydrogenase-like FAD/NAD-binding protein [bacterium]|nr:sulfide/dihydroorotate dehydrogenase-like FAD/NAD-binding protein [bacterium]
MYKILEAKQLATEIKLFVVDAPKVAHACKPGQFIILKINEQGERIPLTIYDYDSEKGTISIIFQEVGKTTRQLGRLKAGDELQDFVGPLGKPIEVTGSHKRIICVGGGVGVAPVYPKARALKNSGAEVVAIIGARSKDLIILEEEMKAVSNELYVCTDDGSYGEHGFVTQVLERLLQSQQKPDLVIAIGPLPMMKACCHVTKKFDTPTLVSLNSIMVDGTGMCGSCRVTEGGQTKFACVDGPGFDGHLVDFNELMQRQVRFVEEEKVAMERYEKMEGVKENGSCCLKNDS